MQQMRAEIQKIPGTVDAFQLLREAEETSAAGNRFDRADRADRADRTNDANNVGQNGRCLTLATPNDQLLPVLRISFAEHCAMIKRNAMDAMDERILELAERGFFYWFISKATGATLGHVRYIIRKHGSKVSDYRSGRNDIAKQIVLKLPKFRRIA
jgi:hypothetical protein